MRRILALAMDVTALPAVAADQPPRALDPAWLKDTMACRGGSGSDAATDAACKHRNIVDRRMAVAGWCYGSATEFGVNAEWHRRGR